MNLRTKSLVLSLLLLIVAVCAVAAQDSEISRTEFVGYLERSDKATRTTPYRRTVTIEISDRADRGWEPYSSAVEECIVPDRSHFTYKTGRQGESIRVGKARYSKEADGSWVRSTQEAEGWLVTPSSTPVFNGPVVEYKILSSPELTEGNTTVLRVVSRPTSGTPGVDKETLTYAYWFDEKGLLYRRESIAFNGQKWTRRIEVYEYDPNIKIEAPIR